MMIPFLPRHQRRQRYMQLRRSRGNIFSTYYKMFSNFQKYILTLDWSSKIRMKILKLKYFNNWLINQNFMVCNIFSREEPSNVVCDRKIDPRLVNCDRTGYHGLMATHGLFLNYDNSFSTKTPTATTVCAEEISR